ncbi:hypothetical protein FA09DRAFT_251957 [Tilletiopsis washingtonensis]|jgi:hypothetical protein|uniref:Uncharacterized protein n=1 Tax=Tilletiopsis washingtonensis TaxID=58919 RepID=A0A316ZB93_9BASI|nr:hypothetical protein FA09DRAFT_251957 [Tilletiopsis washingtonensis]PWN98809.1 hypothetical protein FA09DRAFT_251957 [Tilletiopsis washingtonensis]
MLSARRCPLVRLREREEEAKGPEAACSTTAASTTETGRRESKVRAAGGQCSQRQEGERQEGGSGSAPRAGRSKTSRSRAGRATERSPAHVTADLAACTAARISSAAAAAGGGRGAGSCSSAGAGESPRCHGKQAAAPAADVGAAAQPRRSASERASLLLGADARSVGRGRWDIRQQPAKAPATCSAAAAA